MLFLCICSKADEWDPPDSFLAMVSVTALAEGEPANLAVNVTKDEFIEVLDLASPRHSESTVLKRARVSGTVFSIPGSFRKRYGIFTISRSFGCVSVPNGEPPIGESNPVEALWNC